jgi:hypothetical protein
VDFARESLGRTCPGFYLALVVLRFQLQENSPDWTAYARSVHRLEELSQGQKSGTQRRLFRPFGYDFTSICIQITHQALSNDTDADHKTSQVQRGKAGYVGSGAEDGTWGMQGSCREVSSPPETRAFADMTARLPVPRKGKSPAGWHLLAGKAAVTRRYWVSNRMAGGRQLTSLL